MARIPISLGTLPNDGTGSPLRIAGGYINENFIELYNRTLTIFGFLGFVSSDSSPTGEELNDYWYLANDSTPSAYTNFGIEDEVSKFSRIVKTPEGWEVSDDIETLFIPYSGARGNVNLGANNLKVMGDGKSIYVISADNTTGVASIAVDGDGLPFFALRKNSSEDSFEIRADLVNGSYQVQLPNKGGTFALLSDVDGYKVHLLPGEPIGPNMAISTYLTIPANYTVTDILFETDATNLTFTGAGSVSEVAQPPVSSGYMTSWVMLDGSPSMNPPNFYSAKDAGKIRLIKKGANTMLYLGYSQFNGTYLNVIVKYSNYHIE